MALNSLEILAKATERLGNRIEITFTRFAEGILIQSKQIILSEFLPGSNYKNGAIVFGSSFESLKKQLTSPFFLVSPDPLKAVSLVTEFKLWKKNPLTVGKSEWMLKRVQDVPTLKDYRGLDKNDYLEFGVMDTYTEWFVAYGRTGAEWKPKGKFRITDLDNNEYFVSQMFTLEEGDHFRLLESLEAQFPSRHFFFAADKSKEFPEERGFSLEGTIRIHHSGE